MTELKGVLVVIETANGKVTSVSRELLGAGRRLADSLGRELGALVIGDSDGNIATELIALGADIAYIAQGSALARYHPDLFAGAVSSACQQLKPVITLLGHTDIGLDVAPRVAARLDESLTTDCVGLDTTPDKSTILITRPVYGGKALAEFASGVDSAQIVTVRPHSMPPAAPDTSRQGKTMVLPVSVEAAAARSTLVETVKEEVKGIKLEEAEVVVAGGMGIGDAKGFDILRELAGLLRGAVGASRGPCDEGWVPPSLKIGQTGKIVNPKLYIAVGISGAPQHIAGILGSKYIIAINTNRDANIFRVSDLGVVADYHQALPPFIEECQKIIKG